MNTRNAAVASSIYYAKIWLGEWILTTHIQPITFILHKYAR